MLKYENSYDDKLFEKFWDRSNDGLNVINKDGILIYVNKVSSDYAEKNSDEMIKIYI